MADGKRVSCKNSVEHSGRFAREEAVSRFREFVDERRYVVACGEFGADMQVSLVNDGPFTICLDTDDLKRPRK